MPVERAEHAARVDRQFAVRMDDALADRHAGEVDAIGVRAELEVVADVHGRHEEAELLRELAAHAADARQQVAALRRVDQRHQAIAHFEAEQVHRAHVFPASARCDSVRRRRCAAARGAASAARASASRFLTSTLGAAPAHSAAIDRNAKFGMPGIRPMTPSTRGRDAERLRLAEQLLARARRPCPARATCG